MTRTEVPVAAPPRPTPLADFHRRNGARLTDFSGFELPLQFGEGILREHLHTRSQASLFDVSHLGQIAVTAVSATAAAAGLEALAPSNFIDLPPGRQRYALFTNPRGGIIDDVMVQRLDRGFVLMVNASRRSQMLDHLRGVLDADCEVRLLEDLALLSLQGPAAATVLQRLGAAIAGLYFLDVAEMDLLDIPCRIARCGYSGEDGFEIAVPAPQAEELARRLLESPEVRLAGLGARDTLRLEAGMCLYGQDIDEATTPVEAALEWAVGAVRRAGGARAGGFPGETVILEQLQRGAPRRRRGILPEGQAPVRAGTELQDRKGKEVGRITSGGFSPSLQRPVAMGYVDRTDPAADPALVARVRGRQLPVRQSPLPFLPHRYVLRPR